MSFARSLPILVSGLISAGLWMLGSTFIPAGGVVYGVLVCGEAVPDREIRERLENQGFTGLVSESGQWVLLDDFGSVERIPLDEYHVRILPFDPRNDGYADKLRSLFVHDGQRFMYIPLNSLAAVQSAGVEKRLAAALGEIPYLFHGAASLPAGFLVAMFCLAACAFCIVRPVRLMLRPYAACLIPLLPALAPLALGGAAGFALASLLAGCATLLAGPCLEYFTLPCRQGRRRGASSMVCWLLLPPLILCYGVLAFWSDIPLVFSLLVFAVSGGILLLQLRDAYRTACGITSAGVWGISFKRKDSDYRRFTPVPILRNRAVTFGFSWAMLPFAAVALVLACADIVVSVAGRPVSPVAPPAGTVTEADYRTHYRFQSTFSFRSLNEAGMPRDPPDSGDMAVYALAPDGLLEMANGGFPFQHGSMETTPLPDGISPFPLGNLIRYLDTSGHTTGVIYTLSALLPLLFVFPVLFYGKNARKRQNRPAL